MDQSSISDDMIYSVYNDHSFRGSILGPPVKRCTSNPRRSGYRAVVVSLLILTSLAVVAGTLFLVLQLLERADPGSYMLSEWAEWSQCTQSCDTGNKARHRNCTYLSVQMYSDVFCSGSTSQISPCNEQKCPWAPGPAPVIGGFKQAGYANSENETLYVCEDTSFSIEINSGSQTCPEITFSNGTWSVFNASCTRASFVGNRQTANEGGSIFAQSGYIVSPDFPLKYPDVDTEYHWTVVANGSSIDFRFLTLDIEQADVHCQNSSSISIYCGMNIQKQYPSYGPFCGAVVPSNTTIHTCRTQCSIVKFKTVKSIYGTSSRGFNLVWQSS